MDFNQTIQAIYRQYLGRDPNPYELQGFSQAMKNGYLDPITLTMFIQSTSEFQQNQAPNVASQYASQLTGLQKQSSDLALKEGYDQAKGRFASLGRNDSSGLGSAFAQVAGQVASRNSEQTGQQVGGYLGGVYGGLSPAQQSYGSIYPSNFNSYNDYLRNSALLSQQYDLAQRNQAQALYTQSQTRGPVDYWNKYLTNAQKGVDIVQTLGSKGVSNAGNVNFGGI